VAWGSQARAASLRVAFAGTPEFARVALERLLAAGLSVPLVLTQPDRPAGRGLKLQASPVKQLALDHGLAVIQPRSLRLEGKFPQEAQAARAALEAARPDVMVVAAYGLILPAWVLQWPRLGCLNIHASLLPRWRGAAPIHRAIEAGDAETGITLMQMDEGLDTGAMLLAGRLPIGHADTTGRLHNQLAALGGDLVLQALDLAACGALQPVAQPSEGVTYAHKIEKAESAVDWSQAAEVIARRIRAFDPFPGASTTLRGETLKLWAAVPEPGGQAAPGAAPVRPGTVLAAGAAGVRIACGQGVLRVTQWQRAGGRRLDAGEFLRGFPMAAGERCAIAPDEAGA
jgi:methionyl-tRNA formyltransferase